jgi:hypothetical protein
MPAQPVLRNPQGDQAQADLERGHLPLSHTHTSFSPQLGPGLRQFSDLWFITILILSDLLKCKTIAPYAFNKASSSMYGLGRERYGSYTKFENIKVHK